MGRRKFRAGKQRTHFHLVLRWRLRLARCISRPRSVGSSTSLLDVNIGPARSPGFTVRPTERPIDLNRGAFPSADLSLALFSVLHSTMTSRFLSLLPLFMAIPVSADEGMWLFNNPPLNQLKATYQFAPTPQWLEHLQKASVRFNSGGSGSFVSADGLCITNHHVGADALQKAASEQHNYLKDGFYAKTNAEEIKCADLELNVLMSIEDVTAKVNSAVKSGMSADAAGKARENVIARIEKESKDKTGLRSDVVTLYQ